MNHLSIDDRDPHRPAPTWQEWPSAHAAKATQPPTWPYVLDRASCPLSRSSSEYGRRMLHHEFTHDRSLPELITDLHPFRMLVDEGVALRCMEPAEHGA